MTRLRSAVRLVLGAAAVLALGGRSAGQGLDPAALLKPAADSWPTGQVRFTVDDPLDAHRAQLGKYTDEDMHDVLAYLQTLR